MRYVLIGLSITSSWGNGHATTYRGLVKALLARGHQVCFLERDVPWYRDNRDLTELPGAEIILYQSLSELTDKHAARVRDADVVVVGSYVPEGIDVGAWVTRSANGVTAFYDIDTPITLAGLASDRSEYLSRELVPRYDLYLSFTGGPTLELLERRFGARAARPLYCSVDPQNYYPEQRTDEFLLGYLGTYSVDRQPTLEELLVRPAGLMPHRTFVVAGPQYPAHIQWPANVQRISHVSPAEHRQFFARQRFTLNVTRAEMIRCGHSPSVRLFEAAACGTPIISDSWSGLEEVLTPGQEILVATCTSDVQTYLCELSEAERLAVASRARARILSAHTAAHRAAELDAHVQEVQGTAKTLSSIPASPATAWRA